MEDTASKSHYLKHLQSFNQAEGKVVLKSDAKNNKGMVLAAKGERLNEKNIELMIKNKLTCTLDDCLIVEPALNAKSLKISLQDVLDQNEDIAKVLDYSGAKKAVASCLQHIEQYPQIYQQLTVMAHALPDPFERCLLNSTLSLALAIFSEQSKPDCTKIFFISLVENIGLLHLDPRIAGNELPPFKLWRTYHAHPLLSKEILKKIPSFPPSIIRGVAEHHERIDGTGFPTMMRGETLSTFVHYTGIVDELTRLKYSREKTKRVNIYELLGMLQYRRQHFPNHIFSNLQSMIHKAGVKSESIIHKEELKSFARLQVFYYSKCMLYCDIVARIADSVTATAQTKCKSIIRLQALSKNFIQGVCASGMLSTPIRQVIEECLTDTDLELAPDLIDIDHAHHGILDQIHEIFLFLEYTLEYENLYPADQDSEAYASLQACHALLKHHQSMKGHELGWKALIEEMYRGNNELSAILQSMK